MQAGRVSRAAGLGQNARLLAPVGSLGQSGKPGAWLTRLSLWSFTAALRFVSGSAAGALGIAPVAPFRSPGGSGRVAGALLRLVQLGDIGFIQWPAAQSGEGFGAV